MMRYVHEVGARFRQLCDEQDLTFIPDADVSSYLSDAYDEFRLTVTLADPYFFTVRQTITVAGTSYNLATGAVRIMGNDAVAALSNSRLHRLLKVGMEDGSGNVSYWLAGAASWDEFDQALTYYFLANMTLYFNNSLSGTMRLEYIPESTVDWTVLSPAGAANYVFIDELVGFHDIIVMAALYQYALRDGASVGDIERRLAKRTDDLQMHMAIGRAIEQRDHMEFRPV